MDEVFGYFPPIANPPAKKPLLTLLKTARAYGLGIVLATQNPGDIDYKGLSNVGTWFVGRLTTERDRTRLLEGMADESIEGISRAELGKLIAGLQQRQFIMRSVRGGEPLLFQTRFAMSYLAGPLTRDQIKYLAAQSGYFPHAAPEPIGKPVAGGPDTGFFVPEPMPEPFVPQAAEEAVPAPAPPPVTGLTGPPIEQAAVAPQAASGIPVSYLPATPGQVYRPALAGFLTVYIKDDKRNISHTETVTRFTPLGGGVVPVEWDNKLDLDLTLDDLEKEPTRGATFSDLPPEAKLKTSFTAWQRALVDTVWRESAVEIREHKKLGLVSELEEEERDFIARVTKSRPNMIKNVWPLMKESPRPKNGWTGSKTRPRMPRCNQPFRSEQQHLVLFWANPWFRRLTSISRQQRPRVCRVPVSPPATSAGPRNPWSGSSSS